MKRNHILAWLGLALVLLLLWIWQAAQEEATSATRTSVTASSAPADTRDLRVDAWAADATIQTDTRLPLLVTIYNPTDAAVYVRFAGFQHPGFHPANPDCWQNGLPKCIDVLGTTTLIALPRKVESHSAVTFVANLKAGDEPGRYAVAGLVAWGNDATQITRRKPIALRPVAIAGRFASAILLFLRAFQSFVKDLALPLALAFLGFWLKQQEDLRSEQRKRDEEDRARRRKEEEDARDVVRRRQDEAQLEQRKAAAEKSAQTQQTWNLMLIKSHQNAERHYMPLSTAAARIAEYWRGIDGIQDPTARDLQIDLCFYSYLLYLVRTRRMLRAIGGFYFKRRDGEIVARDLWAGIVNQTDQLFTRDLRERATNLLLPQSTFADYRKGVASLDDVKELRERFAAHVLDLEPMVLRFEALDLILEFEMNIPYEHWYQQREQFKTEAARQVISRMRQAGTPELSMLADTFDQYVSCASQLSDGPLDATNLTGPGTGPKIIQQAEHG